MTLGIPQIILSIMILVSIGGAIARFGQPKKPDTYDYVDVLVGPGLLFGLLWWGGFYG